MQFTPIEIAEYVGAQSLELQKLAESAEFTVLARIFAMGRLEADEFLRHERPMKDAA